MRTAHQLNQEEEMRLIGKKQKREQKRRQEEQEREEDLKRKQEKKEEKAKSRQKQLEYEKALISPKNYSLSDFYSIFKEHYGSVFNLYGICGPGTYCILGPTQQGKSHWIKHAYFYATSKLCPKERRLEFSTKIVISTISRYNKDYSWDEEIIHLEPSNEIITEILNERKKEMKKACKKLGKNLDFAEEWACQNPILIMADDTYGLCDFTTPGNSGARLCTKARHYGIYFVLAAQYIHQLGPVFHDNARAWVCFSCGADNHKKIIDKHHGVLHKELRRKCEEHNKKIYHMVVYITTWTFGKDFHARPNRVFALPPIPPLEHDIKKLKEMENRYSKFEQEEEEDND